MTWYQKNVTLPAFARGFHLVTPLLLEAVPEIRHLDVGLFHVFIQHTSASLTINENADPDVSVDLEMAANRIVPHDFPYDHTIEGPDDMPAHVKAALLGASVTVPISNGRLALGTWQGVFLCEHRNRGGRRRVVITVEGSDRRD